MNCLITHPNAEWCQASTLFKRHEKDARLTIFTDFDNSQSEKLWKLLSSIGIAVLTVMSLGNKDTVINECKTSNLPENKIYIINDNTNYGIHNLYAIQNIENLNKNSKEIFLLKYIYMVKEYLRNNNDVFLLQELEYFRENFSRGWNGDNSMPLDAQVYANIYQITSKFNKQLANWSLVLRTNGSVSIMSDDDRASIDVAREHISFYVSTRENKQLFQRHLKFELSTIEKILELWHHTA